METYKLKNLRTVNWPVKILKDSNKSAMIIKINVDNNTYCLPLTGINKKRYTELKKK